MAAPADPALALLFYDELMATFDSFEDLGVSTNAHLVYLLGAILGGGWVDLDVGASASGEATWETLKQLECYPLIEPYLEQRTYSAEEIAALRVHHRLTL